MNKKAPTPETLWDLIQEIWSLRRYIMICAGIGVLIALIYTGLAQNTYRVTMIVGGVPTLSSQTQMSGPDNSLLTQKNDNSQNLSQMHQSMYKTIFRSPRVAGMILKLPDKMSAISQDKKYGLFSTSPQNWADEDLSRYFHRSIRMAPAPHANDLIVIQYTHPNPDFARSFLLQLHALTDESIRNDHKKLINDRRAYITKALGEAFNLDHKKALGQLLIELEREAIMVNSDRSFSMRIINPPSSSIAPYHPRTKLIIIALFFIGAFIGMMVGTVRKSIIT